MSRRWLLTTLTILILQCGLTALAAAGSATAPGDTIRTNLWVTRALMSDIVSEALDQVPAGSGGILLEPTGTHAALDLMQTVAYDLATARGFAVYQAFPPTSAAVEDEDEDGDEFEDADDGLDAEFVADAPDVVWGTPSLDRAPYSLGFRIEDIAVDYPRSGRRLGLWRTWIDRECKVSAIVVLRDRRDGLILHDGQTVRRFGDRFPAGDLDDLATAPYAFTEGKVVAGGGIGSILEEVVVLSSLAGLIAAYFATTAD